jgi:hypothetical protein
MTVGPMEDSPDAYEAPNGMESAMPGMVSDAGSCDPSATSVAGAMSNATAQMQEMQVGLEIQGGSVGDLIDLPPAH